MGYRGSGKTSVAANIAKKLNWPVISTDNEIVKRVGSINEFVSKNGWKAFRDIESSVIAKINSGNTIVDCGGGFIEREENIAHLKQNGIIIWLKTSPQKIIERIKGGRDRPSLTGTKSFIDEVDEVLTRRLPLYSKAADHEVDSDNKTVEEVSKDILNLIKNEN